MAQDSNANQLSARSLPEEALEGEARPCPLCQRPMTAVVHRVDCPCDAPWCSESRRELTCLECGRGQPGQRD